MQHKNIAMTVVGSLALAGTSLAGESYVSSDASSSGASLLGAATGALSGVTSTVSGDWCETLSSGLKYKSDSDLLQEIKFFGRFQYQWGYTDGEYNGTDFDANGDEIRRLRVGTQVKFLNGFKFKGNVNLEEGGFRNHELGYHSFDELYLSYTMKDVAGFDAVTAGYGRRKVAVSYEGNTSSKKIKTVERSNIGNYFYQSARATGFTLDAERSGVEYGIGVYSTDSDESIGRWDEGIAYHFHLGFEAGEGNVSIDALFNDAGTGDEDEFGYDWGVSVGYGTSYGSWDLALNALYGEATNGDALYGVVIMPSKFLVEDRLEAVLRYQYFGSDGDSVKINSRNVRNAVKHDLGSSVGKGDENHSIYAGLNYYLCDHHAKIMTGVEYETLSGTNVDLDALTFWGAFRMYF